MCSTDGTHVLAKSQSLSVSFFLKRANSSVNLPPFREFVVEAGDISFQVLKLWYDCLILKNMSKHQKRNLCGELVIEIFATKLRP